MNGRFSQSLPDFGERLGHFEAAWSSGRIPDVAGYLRQAGDEDAQFIEDLIEVDLECRWKQFDSNSDPSSKDPYGFPLFPLVDDYAAVLSPSLQQLIFTPRCVAEEYRVRSRWGDKPAKDSFFERFPGDRPQIEAALLQIDTDFENEGIEVCEESSLSHAAPGQSTVILGKSAHQQSRLVPEAELIGTRTGKYRLETRLGHGAFGEVWKAYDPDLKRDVAIKFPRLDKHFPAELLKTFRTEAQKLASLGRIQGVVNVFDCGEHDGKPYFVADFIEGNSLADQLQQKKKFSYEGTAALLSKVARTLQRAHEKDLVHRDIKPANILLDADGDPYLADFGLAISEAEQHSEPESIVGTYAYMAPEQARGESQTVDGRADIYALGVILYRMLTGKLPYTAETGAEYIDKIQHHKIKPPRQRDESIPKTLESICLKCLQKDEDQRYSSAGELAAKLDSSLLQSKHIQRLTAIVVIILTTSLLILAVAFWQPAFDSPNRPEWAHPKVIAWTSYNDLTDEHRWDEEKGHYIFDTLGCSLFQVGKCTSDKLTLNSRFRIHGNRRTVGQGGVFWGLDAITGEQKVDLCCWSVQIGRVHQIADFMFEIRQHTLGLRGGKHSVVDSYLVTKWPIEEPANQVFELEVEATPDEVRQIKLNGELMLENPIPLKALHGRQWRKLKDTGYGMFGKFGTFSVERFSAE